MCEQRRAGNYVGLTRHSSHNHNRFFIFEIQNGRPKSYLGLNLTARMLYITFFFCFIFVKLHLDVLED